MTRCVSQAVCGILTFLLLAAVAVPRTAAELPVTGSQVGPS